MNNKRKPASIGIEKSQEKTGQTMMIKPNTEMKSYSKGKFTNKTLLKSHARDFR
jgi:hypothetical protein